MSDFAAEQLVPFLRNESLLAPLDDDLCRQLAERMELQRFSIGETIFHEGDTGQDAWLIFSGRVRVLKLSESGQQVTLATQSVGEVFGALAILKDAPRSATVRAAEDCVLFRIERRDLEAVLEAASEVRRYFEEFMQERAVRDFLRTATVLETLKSKDVKGLLDRLEPREFSADETIIRQGDEGDALFIIRSGQAQVLQDSDSGEQLLRTLGEGDCFGEWALIEDRTRTATVRATEPTRCFALKREDFDRLFESSPRLRERLARRLALYRETESVALASDEERSEHIEPTSQFHQPHKKQLELVRLTDGGTSVDGESTSDRPRRVSSHQAEPGLFGGWPWIAQDDESDCGAACLAMSARCYGARIPLNRLRDLANVGREGASLFSLAAAADAIGFQAKGIEADLQHLSQVRLPAVAHWQDSHYLVVFAADDQGITIGDPANGVSRVSHEAFTSGWTGRLLLLEPSDVLSTHPQPPSLQTRLRNTLGARVMSLFALASLVLAIVVLASLLQVYGADRVSFGQVTWLLLLCGSAAAVREWMYLFGRARLGIAMRAHVTGALQCVPLNFFHTRFTAGAQRWLTDADAVAELRCIRIRNRFNVAAVCGALALLTWLVPATAGLAAAWLAGHVLVLAVERVLLNRPIRILQSLEARSSVLIHDLAGPRCEATRASLADVAVARNVRTATESIAGHETRVTAITRLTRTILIVSTLAAGYTIWTMDSAAIKREGTLPALVLLAIAAAPFITQAGQVPVFLRGLVSLGRIEGLLAAVANGPTPGVEKLQTVRGHIELVNVSFCYNDAEQDVLSEISLTIPAGQTVAIVGRDGSGRSALARLLQGHYPPTSGSIRVDGRDLWELDLQELRRQMGVATRDSQPVTGTIVDNIRGTDTLTAGLHSDAAPHDPIARPEASSSNQDAIEEAARLAGADGFISRLPQSWNTIVGPLGVELSGSQRQRLGIARALCDQPPILIFDEATSELDDEQENRLWSDLHAVMAERTVLLIPHRLKAARLADHIIVLDGGVIAEQGTHEALLEAGEVYSFLWSQAQM